MTDTAPHMWRRTAALFTLATALLLGVVSPAGAAEAPQSLNVGWVSAWTASPQPGDTGIPGFPPAAPLRNETLRQVVRPHTSGTAVRVRLSNLFGDRPLTLGGATIARRTTGAAVDTSSVRQLTFMGRQSVTLAPGAEITSDPVPLALTAERDMAVDLFLPQPTGVPTQHLEAAQTSYVSTSGNHTGSASLPVGRTVSSWYFLTDVEVMSPAKSGLVTFGDSITDGTGSTPDANRRYPDRLATGLAARPSTSHLAVTNAGIGGGRLLHDRIGPRALDRFDRDVLSKPATRYVLVQIGINDIALPNLLDPGEHVTADEIIAGYQQLIDRAHQRGVTVYGATLLPVGGSFYDIPLNQQKRDDVNRWLRSSAGKPGGFDKVADFDAALRDPADPSRLLPAYDSGDHIHPSDSGHAAMASVAESLFVSTAQRGAGTADSPVLVPAGRS
ncbi:SGNH/GDSL hydrolase family protein [Streptomyces sp. NPDC056716]|uniref:SGNH/GDSL hydrolase family protein n=1 Tax=unclassified Streptomyces TaxID=2593676 RepID=UPI0036BDA2F8